MCHHCHTQARHQWSPGSVCITYDNQMHSGRSSGFCSELEIEVALGGLVGCMLMRGAREQCANLRRGMAPSRSLGWATTTMGTTSCRASCGDATWTCKSDTSRAQGPRVVQGTWCPSTSPTAGKRGPDIALCCMYAVASEGQTLPYAAPPAPMRPDSAAMAGNCSMWPWPYARAQQTIKSISISHSSALTLHHVWPSLATAYIQPSLFIMNINLPDPHPNPNSKVPQAPHIGYLLGGGG